LCCHHIFWMCAWFVFVCNTTFFRFSQPGSYTRLFPFLLCARKEHWHQYQSTKCTWCLQQYMLLCQCRDKHQKYEYTHQKKVTDFWNSFHLKPMLESFYSHQIFSSEHYFGMISSAGIVLVMFARSQLSFYQHDFGVMWKSLSPFSPYGEAYVCIWREYIYVYTYIYIYNIYIYIYYKYYIYISAARVCRHLLLFNNNLTALPEGIFAPLAELQ